MQPVNIILIDYLNVLTEKELEIEREHVHVFDRENNNPVTDMIAYVIKN